MSATRKEQACVRIGGSDRHGQEGGNVLGVPQTRGVPSKASGRASGPEALRETSWTARGSGLTFSEVHRRPLYQQVADQVREAILTGALSPGDLLPTERSLSDTFGVSRASVREALRSLETEGLILSSGAPVGRSVVSEYSTDVLRDHLANLLRLQRVPVDDLVEFRIVLETGALQRVARDPRQELLSQAADALAEMKRPSLSLEDFDAADVRFHLSLVKASGNETMHVVMVAIRDVIARYLLDALSALPDPQADIPELVKEHQAIFDAVSTGDDAAIRRLVTQHLRDFYDRVLLSADSEQGKTT
ncbi:MAG: FadR/GntR family transcriptional regulator [Actinomycetota bacterium]